MPYEEIDHHADVMFHVWGNSFPELLEDAIKAMTFVFLGTSTEACMESRVLKVKSLQIERLQDLWSKWHDASRRYPDPNIGISREEEEKNAARCVFFLDAASLEGLLFRTLDEYLYRFATENVYCLVPRIEMVRGDVLESGSKRILCSLRTIPVNNVHELSGIEVKAVTMHNLRVTPPVKNALEPKEDLLWHAWFVLDI
ncbi:hypothetical protein XU18_0444 [Perkinsela sp. CCAP 1560/4]|nr:hypothetical protein XU18_0444 [Perkinsela sp. CCAP 1560/4]|eukprot:KNH09759.1 hypothetical protein XU18_0444 [Perkinsela sp. CCAP 1560/4]